MGRAAAAHFPTDALPPAQITGRGIGRHTVRNAAVVPSRSPKRAGCCASVRRPSQYEFLRTGITEHWSAMVPENHPLAERESLTPQDLKDVPLLFPVRTPVHNLLLNWFGQYTDQARANIAGYCSLTNNAVVMVTNGLGIFLGLDLGMCYPGVRAMPLSPALQTGSVIVWKKQASTLPAAAEFARFLLSWKPPSRFQSTHTCSSFWTESGRHHHSRTPRRMNSCPHISMDSTPLPRKQHGGQYTTQRPYGLAMLFHCVNLLDSRRFPLLNGLNEFLQQRKERTMPWQARRPRTCSHEIEARCRSPLPSPAMRRSRPSSNTPNRCARSSTPGITRRNAPMSFSRNWWAIPLTPRSG